MELWALLSIAAPGLFPYPDAFKELYAVPIERNGDAEMLAPAAPPDPAAAQAPHQGGGRPRASAQAGAGPVRRRWTRATARSTTSRCSANGRRSSSCSTTSTATASRSCARSPCCASSACTRAWPRTSTSTCPTPKSTRSLEHVDAVAGTGHRTLVFSQFTGLLDLIQARLETPRRRVLPPRRLHPRRAEVIDSFKTGTAPVFLISLKAGGFGLNLTEADYCFLMDPWWNPATELQAVDRTHRIGQTRTVHVYRLIAEHTIEERVLALQARKSELFNKRPRRRRRLRPPPGRRRHPRPVRLSASAA